MIPHAHVKDAVQDTAEKADALVSKALELLVTEAVAAGVPAEAALTGAIMAVVRAAAGQIIASGGTPTGRAICAALSPALHKNATALWLAYKDKLPSSQIM